MAIVKPLHLLPVFALAAVITGCSAEESPTVGSPAAPKADILKPKATLKYDPANPATWVLPIEGYLPTDAEKKQIMQARNTLVSDCMQGYGFSWVPAPELPPLGPKTLVDWRYGIHDLALSKERGYKPSADEQAAYDAAVNKGAVDGTTSDGPDAKALTGAVKEVNGKSVPEGGCSGQAQRQISADALEAKAAQQVANDAFLASQQDPKVTKAFKAWSDCMKGKGYSYAKPLDASDDPAFGSQDVTRREITTAMADISCRQMTSVAKIWFDAESALQQAAIEKQAEKLGQDRKRLDEAVKKAANAVAATR
ncbi:hypothetical protein [Streptomyces sp. NPDC058861]|uniref:hypothetical protein n=1 Tax=Streptomyces sp. NPDC058861 TaxID=3346653 RepID=UPI003681FD4E